MHMQENTLRKDLTTGSVMLLLLRFIGPLFLSNVLQTVYNIVDMAVVGHYVGSAGLSAVSVCGDAVNVLTFLAMGFSTAGQVLTSQYVGAGRHDKLNKLIGNLFSSLLLVSVTFTVLTLILRDDILHFANIPSEAKQYGQQYLTVCAFGLVFTYGYNAVSAILRGMGDSRHPFIFVTVSSVINIVLDLLLVAVFRMEVAGAALATVIAQGVSLVASLTFLYRRREQFGFDFKRESFVFEREALLPVIKLGIPMALQSGCIQGSKFVVSRWVNGYGVAISAITGIGNKFNSIGLTFSSAVSTSSAAIIGQCIGAKKTERVSKTMMSAWVLAVATSCVLTALILVFSRFAFGIFTDDSAVLDLVAVYKPVVAVMLLSSAFRAPMTGLINGSGNSKMNFVLAIVDGLVGHLGLSALFGLALGFGINGLWYGNASAGFTPFFVGLVYYFTGKWKRKSWAEK
jgi:putative MATE family efflux protein